MEIIDPTEYVNWDELLYSTPNGSFFHTSSWAKVLMEAYGYFPKYFTEFEGKEMSTLIPIMEVRSFFTGSRGVSVPFTDYCEPLLKKNVEFSDCFDRIIDYGKKCRWKYIELRGNCNLVPLAPPLISYLGHTLSLSRDEGQIFSSFRDSTKRNIKKATREGVKVEILTSFDSVKEFYRLNCLTRREHGLPPQPERFFKSIYTYIISKDLGFVVLASFQGKYIGGAVFFHFGERAFYKYGASDRFYQHLRANNLVMWEAIKWYSQNGFKTFCFGRTEPYNLGLIQFKSGWGTTEKEINYYRYDLRKNMFINRKLKVKGFQNKIFRNLPIPLLKDVGSIIYRHVG